MKKTAYYSCLSAAALALAITASPVLAKDYTKYSSTVVEFQRKLATGGNAIAQYKLGTMYESGQGVKKDIKEAESWYKQSAAKGHKPAQNRLTYLEIKKSGFDNTKHKPWLASVKSDADALDGDAIILMALMYRDGIGLKKDLKQSHRLLKKASSMGLSEVDGMIEEVEAEIAQTETEPPAKAKPKPKPVAAKQNAAEKQAKQEETKKRQEAAAKKRKADLERKRLEEQRRKLAEEKRNLELQKQKLAAQQAEAKKREEAARKAEAEKATLDPACSGPAARFRTTCK